jgi:hypothetical protein
MPLARANILIGKCYRDSFSAVYRVDGYDGNDVHYVVYDLTNRGKLTERQHSESWADSLLIWKARCNALSPVTRAISAYPLAS